MTRPGGGSSTLPLFRRPVTVLYVSIVVFEMCTMPCPIYAERVTSMIRLRDVVTGLDWTEGAAGTLHERERRLLEPLGEGVTRWVAGAVRRSLDVLEAESRDALAPWPAIARFASHALTGVVLVLAGADAEKEYAIDPDLIEHVVGRDVPLSDITAALRMMQTAWLELLIDAAVSASEDGVFLVPAIASSVTGTMDAWATAVLAAIAEERRRISLTEHVRVRAAIEMLVEGKSDDAEGALRLLELPSEGWHLCCVVGVPKGAIAQRRPLDSVMQAFARAAGCERVLRYDTSAGDVRLWATTARRRPAPALAELHVTEPFAVGLGEPHRGPEGFRRTFVEADDAFQLATRAEAGGGVSYTEAALAILLSQDEERARWFVENELGELGADCPEMADMRNTLRAFFDTRMRIAPAAKLLHIHRNTLINRLQRVEGVIGHGVAERPAQVQAALLLADLLACRQPAGAARLSRSHAHESMTRTPGG